MLPSTPSGSLSRRCLQRRRRSSRRSSSNAHPRRSGRTSPTRETIRPGGTRSFRADWRGNPPDPARSNPVEDSEVPGADHASHGEARHREPVFGAQTRIGRSPLPPSGDPDRQNCAPPARGSSPPRRPERPAPGKACRWRTRRQNREEGRHPHLNAAEGKCHSCHAEGRGPESGISKYCKV